MKILDRDGIISAVILGFLITYFGGFDYLFFMFLFLFLGVIVTRYEQQVKKDMGLYEYERGVENVLSNGLGPTLFAIFSPQFGPIPFLASVAAVTSDTFASEIGVLGKSDPIFLGNLKKAKPGTNGAVSSLGTVASAVGAMLIGAFGMFVFNLNAKQAFFIGLAGFIGSLVDTLVGILEERGIGTKGTTNFICSITGGFLGLLIR
ncbi:MAG: DUF92 domain-containing protein [Candidatus Bilamarchaeaceae archaeon]